MRTLNPFRWLRATLGTINALMLKRTKLTGIRRPGVIASPPALAAEGAA